MFQSKKFLMPDPGGENEGGNIDANTGDKETGNENSDKKPLSEKIHDALQDWANDDQRDQEFDDTRP